MPTEILMPALSPTMELGTLAKSLVKKGDLLPGIETDKTTVGLFLTCVLSTCGILR